MAFLREEEIRHHPGRQHIILPLKPIKAGHETINSTGFGSYDIYYEVHGNGPIKLIWVMGLGCPLWYWQRSTKHFGHENGDRYTCLLIDNRGSGYSDMGFGWYSTSSMAGDIWKVADHIQWGQQKIHLIGVSLGGMIAQEMAFSQPKRLKSLTLISTAAAYRPTEHPRPNVEEMRNLQTGSIATRLWDVFFGHLNSTPPTDDKIAAEKYLVCAPKWCLAPDEENMFPSNGDMLSAMEFERKSRLSKIGFACQLRAVLSHYKTANQLQQIGESVGRKNILVLHGALDLIMRPGHQTVLVAGLNGTQQPGQRTAEDSVQWHLLDGVGHFLPLESKQFYLDTVTRHLQACDGHGTSRL